VAKPPENRQTANDADKSDSWRVRWVDEEDVRHTEAKMKDWPIPQSRADLLTFLNFMSVYKGNLWGYEETVKPLLRLAGRSGEFVWKEEHQQAWDDIKKKLVSWLKRHSKSRMKSGNGDSDDRPREPGQRSLELDDDHSEEEPESYPPIQVDSSKVAVEMDIQGSESLPVPEQKSYRLLAPINKPGVTNEIVERLLDNKVELTSEEVLAISPDVAKGVRVRLTKIRQPVPIKRAKAVLSQDEALPFAGMPDNDRLGWDALCTTGLPLSTFYIADGEDAGTPEGSVVLNDPYEMYLSKLGTDEVPKQVYEAGQKVYTAKASGSLRCLHPLVGKKEYVECIIDNGSQIVSMSLRLAVKLMLSWDPDISMLMEVANGQLKPTEGLAKNVPFVFGDITVYLQVHVIDQTAYDVLLGRPFDILTESNIQNYTDGSSTITIKDPNSGRRTRLPTHARGARSIARSEVDEVLTGRPKTPVPEKTQEQDFQASSRNWE
jgi:hypothetical protein